MVGTGDQSHATKAMEIIDSYSLKNITIAGSDAELLDGKAGAKFYFPKNTSCMVKISNQETSKVFKVVSVE